MKGMKFKIQFLSIMPHSGNFLIGCLMAFTFGKHNERPRLKQI